MILILVPCQSIAAFLEKIVIPRSFSRSLVSMIRDESGVNSLESLVWDWRSIASTRVVFPWSTWAMIATFRMFFTIFSTKIRLLRPDNHAEGGTRSSSTARGSYYNTDTEKKNASVGKPRRFKTYETDRRISCWYSR